MPQPQRRPLPRPQNQPYSWMIYQRRFEHGFEARPRMSQLLVVQVGAQLLMHRSVLTASSWGGRMLRRIKTASFWANRLLRPLLTVLPPVLNLPLVWRASHFTNTAEIRRLANCSTQLCVKSGIRPWAGGICTPSTSFATKKATLSSPPSMKHRLSPMRLKPLRLPLYHQSLQERLPQCLASV